MLLGDEAVMDLVHLLHYFKELKNTLSPSPHPRLAYKSFIIQKSYTALRMTFQEKRLVGILAVDRGKSTGVGVDKMMGTEARDDLLSRTPETEP